MSEVVGGEKLIKDFSNLYNDGKKEYAEYYVGNKKTIVVFSPELVYNVFVKKQKSFIRGITFIKLRSIMGKGLFVSDNPEHMKNKKIMQPAFNKTSLEKSLEDIYETTLKYFNSLEDGEVDVSKISDIVSFMCVSKEFLGTELDLSLIDVYRKLGKESCNSTRLKIPEKDLKDSYDMREKISLLIKSKKADSNFLNMMIDSGMKEDQIVDEIVTILLAGFDTTSALISWCLAYLAENKKILSILKEDPSIWIKENRPPKINEIKKIDLLNGVIKETLRLKPPGFFTNRISIEEVDLGSIKIDKRTHIFASQYITHRIEKYYKNPELWNPQRWSEDFEKSLPRGVFFPFGYGSKKCIGENYAMAITEIFISIFINKYSIKNEYDFPKEDYLISMFPKDGLKLNISSVI